MKMCSYLRNILLLVLLNEIHLHTAHGQLSDDYTGHSNADSDENAFDPHNLLKYYATSQTTKEEEVYVFPPLSRLDPGDVGTIVSVELSPGRWFDRITRAVKPPIFEIPDFLSDEECDHIINSAARNGLGTSQIYGEDNEPDPNTQDIFRVSQQTWLNRNNLGGMFLDNLQNKLSTLLNLSKEIIKGSESMQVVNYLPNGHYHAHLDSTRNTGNKPCCFQSSCPTPPGPECCRICRYATVLYFLNNVDGGGETAFPLADADENTMTRFLEGGNLAHQWRNLSNFCHNSSVVIGPKRGTAIMWYSHLMEAETNYLGEIDDYSYHGGCDVTKGTKWIANNWINAATYNERFVKSIWVD
ncbi:transmembrane prolyl 4-hydroxylase-like [Mya arenaria]|uniref:transmembrane prolyl 4-hydroxylase-like n=1 Tax=Mya arenaria TaxID=6604 RepID=UPI0022E50994|nr:transmembrane prolyl 4-hydroxylase-like [Mya arenaria]